MNEPPDPLALSVGCCHERRPHVWWETRESSGQNGLHERDLGQRRGTTGIAPLVEVRLQLVRMLEIVALYRVRDAEGKFDDRAPASGHEAVDADFREACSSTVITDEDLHVWPRSLELPRDAAILSGVLHAP